MELQISPEPDDQERAAIAAALAEVSEDQPSPRRYASEWRTVGLRESVDREPAEP